MNDMQDIREKLIDLLTGYSLDTYEDVQYVADELIANDVVPVVHGRWGQTEYWKRANKHLILYKTNRCSICNCDISSRLAYNYCPNCGAIMEESEKSMEQKE